MSASVITLARDIELKFSLLRVEYGKAQFPYRSSEAQFRLFIKLAEKLLEWRTQRLMVDSIDYLRAHFEFYKKTTMYPQHLVSAFSFQIYSKYIQQKKSQDITITPGERKARENEMFEYLMRTRREDAPTTYNFVQNLGIFSTQFLTEKHAQLSAHG